MKLYDLTYLLSADLTAEGQKQNQERMRTLVEEKGGVLEEQSPLTLKSMAYPIKKQASAFMGSLRFYLDPEKTPDFSAQLKGQENMLRYLLTIRAAPAKASSSRVTRRKMAAPRLSKEMEEKSERAKTPKVEIEKLEEKLGELLKE